MEYAIGAVIGLLVGTGIGFALFKGKGSAAPIEPVKPAAPPKPSAEPLRILAALQQEARLIDFLMEEISGASDPQIGQAVRDIHAKARAVLNQHLELGPVLQQQEGETATVAKGFDPSAVRVLGNVTGEPPFTGAVQHPGWRVKKINLGPQPAGQDGFVLQPAEVQVG
jgi:Domain of unknown function (DUF2760)